MSAIVAYRQRAAQFREDAEASNRPLVRLMCNKAAQRWDCYAEELDSTLTGGIGVVRQQTAYSVI